MKNSKSTKLSRNTADEPGFSTAQTHDQLARILNSSEFNATDAQRAFLRYVVEKTLAGLTAEIKGYTVATEVFGRGADFNQASDPIVSIQANKLRRSLERYYLVAGQNDPIRIDIPKGTYIPTFQHQAQEAAISSAKDYRPAGPSADTAWPGLVVQPLANLTGNPELDAVGSAIASEIASEITRYQEVHVFLQPAERRKRRASDCGARFVLNGSLNSEVSGFKMNVTLADLSTGRQIWADTHRTDTDPACLMHFGEDVARIVAGKIAAEYGVIARQLSIESKNTPPRQLGTYAAVLRYHEFNAQFTQPSFQDALAALRQASQNEPECGLVWSLLARLYAINYGAELFEMDTPIDDAVRFAQTAVKLDPANQRTRIALAFALMLKDEIPAAKIETNRALDLNPESLIFLDAIGYMMALLGDWQRGTDLIRKAIHRNPYYNAVVHHALWLDLFRRQNYQQAYLETLNFKTPNLFWDHLAKASTLGFLGRIQEGRQAVDELLKRKPDFFQQGERLIRHFVKFDKIADQVRDGLDRLGVTTEYFSKRTPA